MLTAPASRFFSTVCRFTPLTGTNETRRSSQSRRDNTIADFHGGEYTKLYKEKERNKWSVHQKSTTTTLKACRMWQYTHQRHTMMQTRISMTTISQMREPISISMAIAIKNKHGKTILPLQTSQTIIQHMRCQLINHGTTKTMAKTHSCQSCEAETLTQWHATLTLPMTQNDESNSSLKSLATAQWSDDHGKETFFNKKKREPTRSLQSRVFTLFNGLTVVTIQLKTLNKRECPLTWHPRQLQHKNSECKA